MNSITVTEEDICNFERDGAICLRGVFSPTWVEKVATGIGKNIRNPSIYSESLVSELGGGVYFNDYCNWRSIPEFTEFVLNSPAAELAGRLMRSEKSVFYHEHVLVKEAGSQKKTPWHVDQSYYPIDGRQCLSIWMPVDEVEVNSSLRFVAGSHLGPQWYTPRKFATSLNYVRKESKEGRGDIDWVNIPSDAEIEMGKILSWKVSPGDCVVFHMRTIHGAEGNLSEVSRRILSTRWLGDDAVIASRPWEVSPPTYGGIEVGKPAVSKEFPIIWTRKTSA